MQELITEYLKVPARIHVPADTEMSEELLSKLVEIHDENVRRWEVLDGYYRGKAKILERERESHKPNNKIVLAYPRYIVDILLGMFLGKPINYTTNEDNVEYLQMLQEIFDTNDEQDENTEVAKLTGIGGVGYEVVYSDEEANVRFDEISARNMIYVYDDNISSEPLFAIYIRQQQTIETLGDDAGLRVATVYGRDTTQEWVEGSGGWQLVEENINIFGQVNVIEYINNNERMGDFERVLTLIDELNLMMSDTANDLQEFTDALLVLYGALATDDKDVQMMQEDKVLLLEEGQKAEWLIKNINETAVKNERDNLDEKIHKLSLVPNLNDDTFGGAASGESLKYKIYGTDQVIAQKQRKFQTALYKRIELITTILNIQHRKDYNWRDISIVFNDNKPYDELANVRVVSELLKAGISKQEALSRLKGISDVQEEIQRQLDELDPYKQMLDEAIRGDDDDVPADTETIPEIVEE